MISEKTYESLLKDYEELRQQLEQANDAIEAIRSGEVDALVVKKGDDHKLYTLKSADHLYRMFIEQMKEGAVTLNPDAVILYSNSMFASLLGLPLSEVIGRHMSDFVDEDYQLAFRKIFEEGWQSASKGEICIKSKHRRISFLLSATALDLEDGIALSIFLADLTIQKEHEHQLQTKNAQLVQARNEVAKMNAELEDTVRERTNDLLVSREYFKFLADNIPVIVWTTRGNGTADYFNKQWHEYTGLNFEESKDFGAQQALHPEDSEEIKRAWAQAISNKEPFQFDYRLRRADGEYRWHLLKAEPLKDEKGNLIAWFGTSTDIESQKKELERKDEFIGVASHELKTPLTSLKGYIQLIGMHKNLPAPIDLYIDKANASLNKLQHLINDLLDVSKIKAGRLKFSTGVLNIGDLVRQCIDNCRYIYPTANISFRVDQDLFVDGNAERLEQVVMNLVNNAVKYSPGKCDIHVHVSRKDNEAMVSVSDCGIGLSPADQEKIFDRFYRVDTNAANISGLGMGLYISAEIIRQHHGSITVKSALKEGSTFSFLLPLVHVSINSSDKVKLETSS